MPDSKQYRVLTAVGADRRGLVEQISKRIHTAGANLEDSRMAILGGEFALILLFSGTEEAVAKFAEQSDAMGRELQLDVALKSTSPPHATPDYLPYTISVSGVDRPGIVAHVSSLLAERNINVAALESGLSYAPLSGTPLFQLRARLQIPSEVALSKLRAAIAKLCEDENLDFLLESARN